jgi:hypothetical protein
MPKAPIPLDQAKAGLQDDHDPRDIGQQQNNLPNIQRDGGQHVNEGPTQLNQGGAINQERQPPEQTGSFKPPKQQSGPYDCDKQSGDNPEKQFPRR